MDHGASGVDIAGEGRCDGEQRVGQTHHDLPTVGSRRELRGLKEGEGAAVAIEEIDEEGRIDGSFARSPAWWPNGPHGTGLETEEGFGGSGTVEPLMGTEQEVVGESGFEPSLQIPGGQGWR